MISIKIDDILFSHCKYSTAFQESKYINWNRSPISGNDDIAVYTDNSLDRVNPSVKKKIGWLLESPAISERQQEWIKNNHDKFDLVFTNNKDVLSLDEGFTPDNINSGKKFKFLPTGGCWIRPEDQKVYDKNILLSIIASNKDYTEGHRLRGEVINRYRSKMDVFGRGYNQLNYKLDGLRSYMFSIVIENTKKDYYFTEKIIDCFATGTIPIYWGCPAVSETFMFFDNRGILAFNNISELDTIISNLSEDLYNSKKDYIDNNFHKMKEYLISEDYLYEKYNYLL